MVSQRKPVWLLPNPKTNPNLDPSRNPNRGQVSSEGNCPDTIQFKRLSFNFAMTKICVAIRLAEDGTRMGGIQFRLSPSILLTDQISQPDCLYFLRYWVLCLRLTSSHPPFFGKIMKFSKIIDMIYRQVLDVYFSSLTELT